MAEFEGCSGVGVGLAFWGFLYAGLSNMKRVWVWGISTTYTCTLDFGLRVQSLDFSVWLWELVVVGEFRAYRGCGGFRALEV